MEAAKPKRPRSNVATLDQYDQWDKERTKDTSAWRKAQCTLCGRDMREKEMRRHRDSDRCKAYAMLRRMHNLDRAPAPKSCAKLLQRLGLACEVGPALTVEAQTTEAVYVREDVAALCRILKGPMLRWSIEQCVMDEEFRDSLKTIRHIDSAPIAIVKFVEPEYEARRRPRRRKW
jgi:hypothetical protein